jgi:hypothetical protein
MFLKIAVVVKENKQTKAHPGVKYGRNNGSLRQIVLASMRNGLNSRENGM